MICQHSALAEIHFLYVHHKNLDNWPIKPVTAWALPSKVRLDYTLAYKYTHTHAVNNLKPACRRPRQLSHAAAFSRCHPLAHTN